MTFLKGFEKNAVSLKFLDKLLIAPEKRLHEAGITKSMENLRSLKYTRAAHAPWTGHRTHVNTLYSQLSTGDKAMVDGKLEGARFKHLTPKGRRYLHGIASHLKKTMKDTGVK